MHSLLAHTGCRWVRLPLPDGTGHLVIRRALQASSPSAEQELACLPPDALGVVVVRGANHFFLAAGAEPAYLNADPFPGEAGLLRERDRVTWHLAGGPLRVWLVQEGPAVRSYDGSPPGVRCGYCAAQVALGETIATCSACGGEVLHLECAAHAQEQCPRCGQSLVLSAEPWWPAGFPAREATPDERD